MEGVQFEVGWDGMDGWRVDLLTRCEVNVELLFQG
jgi:hypothetical protein